MSYYLVSFIFFYTMFILGRIFQERRFIFIVAGAVPLAFMTIFRGSVGTDTFSYIQSIENIQIAGSYSGKFEPLFEYIILMINKFTEDPQTILLTISGLITFILFWGAYRLEKHGVIFAACIIPQFYFDMTMNGVRYGLSFACVLLATSFLVQKKEKTFWFIVLIAGMVQLSGLILGGLLYALIAQRKMIIAISLALGLIIGVVFKNYLIMKLSTFTSMQSPSILSGLAPLFVSLATLGIWTMDPGLRKNSAFMLICLFILSISMYGLTRFSYAGIRFQQLVLFLILIIFMAHMRLRGLFFSKRALYFLVFLGLISFGFKLRNFTNDANIGVSPFIPYHFYWSENG